MTNLYRSGFTPPGTPKSFERTSVSVSGNGQAGDIFRRHGVPEEWGDPIEAVGWFRQNGELAVLIGDFADGHRVTCRRFAGGRYSLSTIALPTTKGAMA